MKQTLNKGLLFLTIILIDMLGGMEFDLFVPSFPELQSQFSLSPFWVEALLSVNFTGYCLSLFFVGSLADHYGRKPIILLGLTTFILGSILCLWAPFSQFLFIGRFFQGIGIAAPAILSFLIIADTYSLKRQQSLMAILNGVMNISVGVAPVIGSYIALYFHWQGNFMTLLFLGLLAFIMTILFVPFRKLPERKETLSLRGYLPIFHLKPLRLIIMHLVFKYMPYWIFVGMSPLLYMEALGVSLSHFGYYQGVLALVFALGSFLFGPIVNTYDQKKMLILSNLIFCVSLTCVALITILDSQNALLITLAFIPFVVGQVIPGALLTPLALNLIPEAKGRVSAILQGVSFIFSGICLQIAGYFYVGSFQNIGIIILVFILLTIITLFFVIRNHELMRTLRGD